MYREISIYLNLDLQKTRLFQQDDFTHTTAFATIDKYSNNYIDFDNLRSFLLGQAQYPEKDDVVAILRRMDRNNKGIITLDEFVTEIEPLANTTLSDKKNKEETPNRTLQSPLSYRSPLLSSEKAVGSSYNPWRTSSNTRITSGSKISFAASPERIVKGNKEEKFLASQKSSSLSTAPQTVQKEANPLKELTLSPEKEVQKTLTFTENKLNISLVHTLRQLLKFAKELEVAKVKLALRPDFNIPAFFRTFKPELRVFVPLNQFEQGFRQYCIYPDKTEVQLLFKKLDKDEDGALRTPDFEDMLLSNQYEYSSMVLNRGPFNREVQLDVDQVKIYLLKTNFYSYSLLKQEWILIKY